MPAVARITDIITTNHNSCGNSSPISEGSTNVFVNGKGAVRVGDKNTHNEEEIIETDEGPVIVCVPHTVTIGSGSGSVFVNGKAIARRGDTFSGEVISTGSINVFAGWKATQLF